MKSIHLISAVILIIGVSQCTPKPLFGILGDIVSTAANAATGVAGAAVGVATGVAGGVVDAAGAVAGTALDVAGGVVNVATDVVGGTLNTLGGVAGGLGLGPLGEAVNIVGKVAGGLVQTVGDGIEGVATVAGVVIDGVVGLTKALLDALNIFKKDDIPLYRKPLDSSNSLCMLNFALQFQLYVPQTTRYVNNIYQIADHLNNLHNYCIALPAESQILICLDAVRESYASEFNKLNVDLATINVNLAAQWGTLIKNKFMECYVKNG